MSELGQLMNPEIKTKDLNVRASGGIKDNNCIKNVFSVLDTFIL